MLEQTEPRPLVYGSRSEPIIGIDDVVKLTTEPTYKNGDNPIDYYFHPAPHRYVRRGPDGGERVLPSVTQVLEAAGYIDTRWYPVSAARRGSTVHAITSWIDDGLTTIDFFDGHKYQGYAKAWEHFKMLWYFKPEEVEVFCLGAEEKYAGTIDRIGRFANERILRQIEVPKGAEIMIDLKTGRVEKWHALQLEAYRQTRPDPDNCCIFGVYLRDTGEYSVNRFSGDYTPLWDECLEIYYRKQDRVSNEKDWHN